MVEYWNYGTFFVVVTSCLTLVATEDMQITDAAANFKAENPDTPWEMHQQHKLPHQQQQQQLGSRYTHLAADVHALLANKIDPSRYPVPRRDEPRDQPFDLTGPIGFQAGAGSSRGGKHFRLKKGETTAPFLASDEHLDPDFVMDVYPPIDDETILTHSSAPGLSPYLSAKEFRGTFRRSNPYFLGKRARYLLSDYDMSLTGDKRGAPIFVGRRGSPDTAEDDNYLIDFAPDNSVGLLIEDTAGTPKSGQRYDVNGSVRHLVSNSQHTSDGMIAKAMESENIMDLTLEEKRRAPKFVGRRRAPSFVGKRGAPKFFGKRVTAIDYTDDGRISFEDKRASPKFVGKRGPSYFPTKGDAPRFIGKRVKELEESSLSGDKRKAPKFVGRGAAPYFVGKRSGNLVDGKYVSSSILH